VHEDVRRNQAVWNASSADYQRRNAARLSKTDPTWGVWGLPERELRVLGDVAGKDVLELGCGGAQWSICLARRGARMTGLDVSEAQLAFAREQVKEAGVEVRLVHASADETGLPSASFDLVFADHGAPGFVDPARWVPEVARLLRKGGRLAFNAATPWLHACFDPAKVAVGETLVADYFGMHRFVDPEDGLVEFMLGYGDWIRLFLANGLRVVDLVELRPPEDAWTTYTTYAPPGWARRWPAEQIWKVEKEG
jgi:SAM-dependent methyltransferase